MSNKPYWDSHLGFHPWGLAFFLPSLPSSFPQILLWVFGGCIWTSQRPSHNSPPSGGFSQL